MLNETKVKEAFELLDKAIEDKDFQEWQEFNQDLLGDNYPVGVYDNDIDYNKFCLKEYLYHKENYSSVEHQEIVNRFSKEMSKPCTKCDIKIPHQVGEHDNCCSFCGGQHSEYICPEK